MGPKQPPALSPLIRFLHLKEKLDRGGGVGERRESKGVRSETMSGRYYFRGPFYCTGFIYFSSLFRCWYSYSMLAYCSAVGIKEGGVN